MQTQWRQSLQQAAPRRWPVKNQELTGPRSIHTNTSYWSAENKELTEMVPWQQKRDTSLHAHSGAYSVQSTA